jgi:hypothetical protein
MGSRLGDDMDLDRDSALDGIYLLDLTGPWPREVERPHGRGVA